MKKIYIAGKVRGLKNYREVFAKAEKELKAQGYITLNPAELPEGMNGEDYMRICIPMLEVADAIFLLSNWKDSEGAKVEKAYAELQGKEIIYQERNEKKNADIGQYKAEISALGNQISQLGNQSQELQNKLDKRFREVQKVVNLMADNLIAEEIRKIRKISRS